MAETNRDGSPVAPEPEGLDHAWEAFQQRLAGYLAGMGDAADDDHLLLEVAGHDGRGGCSPYAQFASFGDGEMLRAEISGNHYLAPQFRLLEPQLEAMRVLGWDGGDDEEPNWCVHTEAGEVGEMAALVARTLRIEFGLPHPGLLTYQAWGPASADIGVLGLCASDEVPSDVADDEGEPPAKDHVLYPDGPEALVERITVDFREWYDGEPTIDDDGDFVLLHLGQPVWVRARKDQPAVEVMARVAHGVRSRRGAALEIGLLNRDREWVKWTLRDRDIWQSVLVPAWPYVDTHLLRMIEVFTEQMTETRDDLALRTGARVA